jgi:hypothetical protein
VVELVFLMDVQVNFPLLIQVHGVNNMVVLVNDQIVMDYHLNFKLAAFGDLIGFRMLIIQQ